MPWQVTVLATRDEILPACPLCDADPFRSALRGQVQRHPLPWWKRPFYWLFREKDARPYCAIICRDCMEIVGWETLTGKFTLTSKSVFRILIEIQNHEESNSRIGRKKHERDV